MPTLVPYEICTGCYACYNACKHQAIAMKEVDAIGHLYPIVDDTKCIECKLCEKSCPVLKPIQMMKAPYAVAAWAKDEDENKASTSGGAASCLARYVIEKGGIVYGCANIDSKILHIRIDKIEDIELLRGSKYVRSDIGLTYRSVKDDLRKGEKVLFIGTPCQVAGLLALVRNNENLMTVDLICHGTPSHQLLINHVKEFVNPDDIKSIKFRDQGSCVLRIVNNQNEIVYDKNYWKQRFSDAYLYTFMNGYSYRESCYTCPYAKPQRCSDITLGDFWGLGDEIPFKFDFKNNGISVVLPNSKKGNDLIKQLSDRLYMVERPVEEAIKGNDQLRSPKRKSITAMIFRQAYTKGCSIKHSLMLSDLIYMPIFWIREKIKGTR